MYKAHWFLPMFKGHCFKSQLQGQTNDIYRNSAFACGEGYLISRACKKKFDNKNRHSQLIWDCVFGDVIMAPSTCSPTNTTDIQIQSGPFLHAWHYTPSECFLHGKRAKATFIWSNEILDCRRIESETTSNACLPDASNSHLYQVFGLLIHETVGNMIRFEMCGCYKEGSDSNYSAYAYSNSSYSASSSSA